MQFPETAISPCPNDTFAFFGFAEKNRAPLTYLDIEQLNLALLEGHYDFAKGSFAIMEKIAAAQAQQSKKVIKTWSRRSRITPEAVGLTFAVHNGRKFVPVFVTEQMVGHKLGEFSPTRTFKGHSGGKGKAAAK